MIDLIIAYLALIVVILLFIIVFLTLFIIYERRKINSIPLNKDKRIVVPLLTLKTNDRSSGDHSNSATLPTTHKRLTKRLRHRPPTLFIRTQNSKGFLLSNGDLSTLSIHNNKLLQQTTNSPIDQTTIHFDC